MIDTVDENDNEENYMTTEEKSFTTSTPRKWKFKCDEWKNLYVEIVDVPNGQLDGEPSVLKQSLVDWWWGGKVRLYIQMIMER